MADLGKDSHWIFQVVDVFNQEDRKVVLTVTNFLQKN